ncbi:MAG: glycerate kinase [Bacteroidota bacterium]|nr:glycerate kinase [Bacteroidota bacterium]
MILITPDKFKGTFSARQIASMIRDGLKKQYPELSYKLLPLADGGEGSAEILSKQLNASPVYETVSDPIGRPIRTSYYYSEKSKTAVVESAKASGLSLLLPEEYNPVKASSFGTGELILSALCKGAEKILITLGGSAVNDAGCNALQALGFRFLDEDGKSLNPSADTLGQIRKVEDTNLKFIKTQAEFIVLSDVRNPLLGKSGAAYSYAPQKGADRKMLKILEYNMSRFAKYIETLRPGIVNKAGAGAAGGMGAGFSTFLNADIVSGASYIMEEVNFDNYLQKAKLVITGEGNFDEQSLNGKVPGAVYQSASYHKIPTAVICGGSSLKDSVLPDNLRVYPLFNSALPQKDAERETPNRIDKIIEKIIEDVDFFP